MDIATYIKAARTTPAQLAQDLECSRSHIYDILRGRRNPGKKLALKLEAVTGRPWHEWVSAQ